MFATLLAQIAAKFGLSAEQAKGVVRVALGFLDHAPHGIGAVVDEIKRAGLSSAPDSWVGDGAPALDAAKVPALVGPQTVKGLAGELHVGEAQATAILGYALPQTLGLVAPSGTAAGLPEEARRFLKGEALPPGLPADHLVRSPMGDWLLRGAIFALVLSLLWWLTPRTTLVSEPAKGPAQSHATAETASGGAPQAAAETGHPAAATAPALTAHDTAPGGAASTDHAQAAQAEATKPEAAQADATKADIAKPEAPAAEAQKAEAPTGEAPKTEATQPEATQSEATQPEATMSQATVADAPSDATSGASSAQSSAAQPEAQAAAAGAAVTAPVAGAAAPAEAAPAASAPQAPAAAAAPTDSAATTTPEAPAAAASAGTVQSPAPADQAAGASASAAPADQAAAHPADTAAGAAPAAPSSDTAAAGAAAPAPATSSSAQTSADAGASTTSPATTGPAAGSAASGSAPAQEAADVGTIPARLRLREVNGTVIYSGAVPDEATAEAIKSQLAEAFGADKIRGAFTVNSRYAAPAWLSKLPGLIGALKSPGFHFSLSGTGLDLKALAPSVDRDQLTAALSALLPDVNVTLPDLRGPTLNTEGAMTALGQITGDYRATDVLKTLNEVAIEFATGSAEVPADSKAVLVKAATLIKALPGGASVVIEGYTDNVGEEAFNQTLSQERADAVRAIMIETGLSADDVTATGYGSANPIADNATPEGRARNRRITYEVRPK